MSLSIAVLRVGLIGHTLSDNAVEFFDKQSSSLFVVPPSG